MISNIGIDGAWITLNRACNMRCQWCYAHEKGFQFNDSMSLVKAKKIVDFCAMADMRSITLIGGEPTIWGDLFVLCEYIRAKNLEISLVTNGLRFQDDQFIEKLIHSGIDTISFSLKSGNQQQHKDLTHTDTFDAIMRSVGKITSAKIPIDFSIVVSSLVIDNLVEIIKSAADNGGRGFSLQFCSTTFTGSVPSEGFMIVPAIVARKIVDQYDELCTAARGPVFIEQALPACVWPSGFLDTLWKNGNMSVGCHVMDRSGLIFDPQGRIIPCNCLAGVSLGQFEKDFFDVETFKKFWHNESIEAFYQKITSYPSQSCIDCDAYVHCGGGCPLQWFVYSPDSIITGQIPNFANKEAICQI